jgi:pimeloyl-ACP methyl ester carboxylesterase
MKTEVISCAGDWMKPVVIFVHGLGMDKNIWADPANSRILGGMFPMGILLSKDALTPAKDKIAPSYRTLFHDLKALGYPVVAWSQKRPAGPMDFAVSELDEIIVIARSLTERGIILIGHSRGGLIARKYLMTGVRDVKGLITISTPHKGSSVAKIGEYLSPLGSLVAPFIPKGKKGLLAGAIKRISDFLRSGAFLELLPESDFFRSLKDGPLDRLVYASFGGTRPTLFSIHTLSFPDTLERIIPEQFYPEEMKKGKGDGLVSAVSSRLPWSCEHHDFHCNHAEVLFDGKARESAIEIIESIDLQKT